MDRTSNDPNDSMTWNDLLSCESEIQYRQGEHRITTLRFAIILMDQFIESASPFIFAAENTARLIQFDELFSKLHLYCDGVDSSTESAVRSYFSDLFSNDNERLVEFGAKDYGKSRVLLIEL
eukprot:gene11198-23389_t